MAIDYSNMDSVISALNKLMTPKTGKSSNVPAPLIIVGAPQRSGLSASKIASRIIARKSEIYLSVYYLLVKYHKMKKWKELGLKK